MFLLELGTLALVRAGHGSSPKNTFFVNSSSILCEHSVMTAFHIPSVLRVILFRPAEGRFILRFPTIIEGLGSVKNTVRAVLVCAFETRKSVFAAKHTGWTA
jgi:hypothetical protein